MKKLVFGLIATVMFGNFSFGQESNITNFLKSVEYSNICKNFNLNTENLDVKNYASILHESKNYTIYRISVLKDNKINFITFFQDGENYVCVYEKNEIEKGMFEIYNQLKELIATFNIKKVKDNSYLYTINNVYENKATPCEARIYKILKAACESDTTCDYLCDLNPTCHHMLGAWANAYCATH